MTEFLNSLLNDAIYVVSITTLFVIIIKAPWKAKKWFSEDEIQKFLRKKAKGKFIRQEATGLELWRFQNPRWVRKDYEGFGKFTYINALSMKQAIWTYKATIWNRLVDSIHSLSANLNETRIKLMQEFEEICDEQDIEIPYERNNTMSHWMISSGALAGFVLAVMLWLSERKRNRR